MNIILTGAPGSGKGSQAPFLEKLLKTPVISTGNMLRAEIASGTELGNFVAELVDKGKLVPDELIIQILASRISQPDCHSGFILDGVPRTVEQAKMMEALNIKIDSVIYINVPDDVIKSRLGGRRCCLDCGETYHIEKKPPIKKGECDACGKDLVIRKDDTPEVISERLETYHSLTEPVLDFYDKKRVRILKINGEMDIKDVNKQISNSVLRKPQSYNRGL